MNRLLYPVNIMELENPKKFFIDCPIDVYPDSELRRIEVPRELARYLYELQEKVARLERENRELAEGDGAPKKNFMQRMF